MPDVSGYSQSTVNVLLVAGHVSFLSPEFTQLYTPNSEEVFSPHHSFGGEVKPLVPGDMVQTSL